MIRTGIFFAGTIFIYLDSIGQQTTDFNMPFYQDTEAVSKNIPAITTDFNMPFIQDTETVFKIVPVSNAVTYPKRELRCAWIATVHNIDYPSATGLSVAALQSQYIFLIDKLYNAGINSVFVQVRPSCDAFYKSPYEPWSEWLSGTQGVAPAGNFDPLVFMIDETHKRGMEFHAWLNPYRAVTSTSASIASSHISVTQPSWCVTYNTLKMLNPGLPQVRDYVTKIVGDIVRRYKIDGIHFDDYFYPYPTATVFNDAAAFSADPRGFTNKDDWRRDNVNLLVKLVNDSIKLIKSHVKFGIGPFGIWKSGVPSGITGLSSYFDIYCDPLAWLADQSVDYLTPQLYWKIGGNQDFNKLVDWWGTQANNNGRHMYAGMASYNLDPGGANWAINDILNQIISTRLINHKAQGEVFFSAQSIPQNFKKFADSLTLSFNKYKCLIPPMQWIDAIPPLPPVNVTYTTTANNVTLNWQKPLSASDGDTAKYFVIYRNITGASADTSDPKQILYISPSPITTYTDNFSTTSVPGIAYAITTCDKLNNESSVVYVNINVTITPPANDNCSNAQTLTSNSTCVQTPGDIINSTASGVAKPSCDGFGTPVLEDVWYKFVAASSTHTITVTPSWDFDPVLSLYTSCSAVGEIGCADNGAPGIVETINATGLAIGTTYYVRVYDYGAVAPSTSTFDICVTEPNATGLTEIGNTASVFYVYPNPFDGIILYGTIADIGSGNMSVKIYGMTGSKILSKQVQVDGGTFSLSFADENLKAGIYMLVVIANDKQYIQRIVVK